MQAPVPTALPHHGLLRQAVLTPQETALISPTRELTYRRLSTAADHVARALLALGVQYSDRVAVVMGKGWQQIAVVHGILRPGAAYLPVDPALPLQCCQLLLTVDGVQVQAAQPGLTQLEPPLPVLIIDDGMLDTPTAPLPGAAGDITNLAYTTFTPGSTGIPKGVMIDHRTAMNILKDIDERFGLNAQNKVSGLSSLSLNLPVHDAFVPLIVGAVLVLPKTGREKDPRYWQTVMAYGHVSARNVTLALMQMPYEYHSGDRVSHPVLHLALLSGDWAPLTLPKQMRKWFNETMDIVSPGGVVEHVIWSVCYLISGVESTQASTPYGRSPHNRPVYVLDTRLKERPVEVGGEICTGGIGLARGYLSDAEKTVASFVWRGASGERIYRTGDHGRYPADGRVAFLERNDTQVKVNSHHIKLGEVRNHLEQLDSVRGAAVACHQGQLYAFITAAENLYPGDTSALSVCVYTQLAMWLLYYLLPQRSFLLKVLPMIGSGKTDQAAMIQEATQRMS